MSTKFDTDWSWRFGKLNMELRELNPPFQTHVVPLYIFCQVMAWLLLVSFGKQFRV
jgi:hypothetical protein